MVLEVRSLRLGSFIGLTSAKCLTINAIMGNETALTEGMPDTKRGTSLAVTLLREVRKGSHGNDLKASRQHLPPWSPASATSGPASNIQASQRQITSVPQQCLCLGV